MKQSGFTLIEVIIGMAILAIVSVGLYQAYSNVLEIVQSGTYNSAALNIMESEVESVRNMRYEDVGTVGGVPNGLLPQTKTVTLDGTGFVLHTYVRNIDDPFDGILGGSPNDTAPSDYKLVELQVTCDTCTRYQLLTMATYVAPKNLENTTKSGNLFVRVFDANGQPVSGASVHVTNTAVTPAINLTDITDTNGQLALVGTATSSAGYHIVVTKTGYSSDQTNPPGAPANPTKPDATVASQQLTITSLAIDRESTISISAKDQFCQAIPGFDFLATGGKLAGTSPNTPKYSVAQVTDATGIKLISGLEWDNYTLKGTDTAFDIVGHAASLSFTLNPNTTQDIAWLVASRSGSTVALSVRTATGEPINDATITLTKSGFSGTTTSGRVALSQTTWPAGSFDSQSGNIDTTTTPGTLTLASVGGIYATASQEWLISKTFDLGTASTTFGILSFNPPTQPAQTQMSVQVAANTDNATWNWVGPDGTGGTFFTTSGQALPTALAGNRYLRYRVYLTTDDENATPTFTDIALTYRSGCIIAGQTYLTGLATGTYTITVTKSGYQPYTASLPITASWQESVITLTP